MLTNGPPKPKTLTEMPPTCDGRCDATGRCDPKHPLHCCHLARTNYDYYPMVTWVCEKCGRFGKWLVNVKNGRTVSTTSVIL